MEIYAIAALFIRLFLVIVLFQKGKANKIEFVIAASLLLGFYVYLFTLILLIKLGLKMWSDRVKGLRLNKDLLIFVLTWVIFLKGPGAISVDKLLGNI